MSKLFLVGVGFFLGAVVIGLLTLSTDKEATNHVDVDSFNIGEKVKYRVYDGTVTGKYRGDRYSVNYCGNIGWFNSYDCQETIVNANELGKATPNQERIKQQ